MSQLPEWWTKFWTLMIDSLTIDPFNFILVIFTFLFTTRWLKDKRKVAKIELAKRIARARFDIKDKAFLESLNEVELTFSDDQDVMDARDKFLESLTHPEDDSDKPLEGLLCTIFQRSGLWTKDQAKDRNTLRCFKQSDDDGPDVVAGDEVSTRDHSGKDSRKARKRNQP